jgi:ubiquinone/menaquinone biosynthesis C-methylase UbiE
MSDDYYDAVARRYDALVDRPLRGVRAAAARALDPPRDATVLDLGCGSGVNFAHLRDRLGPVGTLVGVDVSRGMLSVADRRVRAAGWENVTVVRGDARRPPVADPDAVFASLLSAFFDDPGAVVREWADLVGPGGRLGLLDFGRSAGLGRPLNPLFLAVAGGVSPEAGFRYDPEAVGRMERLNEAAHEALVDHCRDVDRSSHFLGFATVTVGTVEG